MYSIDKTCVKYCIRKNVEKNLFGTLFSVISNISVLIYTHTIKKIKITTYIFRQVGAIEFIPNTSFLLILTTE